MVRRLPRLLTALRHSVFAKDGTRIVAIARATRQIISQIHQRLKIWRVYEHPYNDQASAFRSYIRGDDNFRRAGHFTSARTREWPRPGAKPRQEMREIY